MSKERTRLRLSSWTAACGTARTVVWEEGGGNTTSIRLFRAIMVYAQSGGMEAHAYGPGALGDDLAVGVDGEWPVEFDAELRRLDVGNLRLADVRAGEGFREQARDAAEPEFTDKAEVQQSVVGACAGR